MPEDLEQSTIASPSVAPKQPPSNGYVTLTTSGVEDGVLPCPWYVVQTKVRQENRAAANLQAWNVESYVPWLPGRRRTLRPEPLFPGYIFSRFSAHELRNVSFTRGVAAIVRFGGVPATIEDEVISAIRRRIEQYRMGPLAKAFHSGDPVAIKDGPFRNLVGILETEMPGRERVRLLLATASCAVRLEISRAAIAKAHFPSCLKETDAA